MKVDPDGNGVELYRVRPPEEWPRDAAGNLAMVTEPLDLEELLAQAEPSSPPSDWSSAGAPRARTR